jgi:putative transposase
MKQSRFTEQQVVRILAEGDKGEKTVTDICREHGISTATYYNWRRRFRGMGVDEVREYRKLKRENARLKKLLADREIEIDALQEVVRKKL